MLQKHYSGEIQLQRSGMLLYDVYAKYQAELAPGHILVYYLIAH